MTQTAVHPAAATLEERYTGVRRATEALAAPLSAEDQTAQSMADVSPTKWHRAHTSWFFETFVLGPFAPGYRVFDDRYAYLFNSYYETVGPFFRRSQRGVITRPGAAQIGSYRSYVDQEMTDFLMCGVPAEVEAVIDLGCHHEQQHQELILMDIKHVLSANPLAPAYAATPGPPARCVPAGGWVGHEGGLVEVGHHGPGFAFDNENPRHQVYLQPFELSAGLVTNGRWLEFMAGGGYRRPELWLSEGWARVQEGRWSAPLYWDALAGGSWGQFTLAGARPVDPGEPVCHVSYFEADAFARWAGARLPTEFEWEVLAADRPVRGRFLDPGALHPCPPEDGSQSLFGDVWQWTSSSYGPYPGYQPGAGALGEYNGKFMANQYVLRGGSCVTPPGHARATYRNFFPAAARWAFSGLRLARNR